ncbi:MAG: diaminopimelate decarboxylase [Candidatus Diapherotrites archaeon]|uniref:Diaminopimelate decarboxylase n=1 Tax=Candidatus Iainarchaeum sp. TaxID=3101447 RepID=A0A938YT03_9ARCH|nr:diaminopimelate decarboxylase [Candidatus Diapherotrites archaeon]
MWWEQDGHLEVRQNQLYIAGFSAEAFAKQYGTPLYVYNGNRVIENFRAVKEAFSEFKARPRIHFAMKANSHIAILKLLEREGAFIDAVSPAEVQIALKAGFPREKILFTGTSVSTPELKALAKLGITINIDSFSQMQRLRDLGFKGDISIRWNPGIGAGLHSHTITAGKFIKFGIPEHKIESAFLQAKAFGFNLVGLHQHIGSGWLGKDVDAFLETVGKTIAIAVKAEELTGKKLKFVDFGGGPGIRYRMEQAGFPLKKYAKGIVEKMNSSGLKAEIAIEPGRFIVGDAGIFLCEINTVEEKNIPVIGVNAGFNDLVRPAFYGSYHEIVVCSNVNGRQKKQYMVAGNLCESSDVFNESREALRELPTPNEGGILAILNAGAYGFAMASNYNSRLLPACVLLLDGRSYLIRERQSLDELIKSERES